MGPYAIPTSRCIEYGSTLHEDLERTVVDGFLDHLLTRWSHNQANIGMHAFPIKDAGGLKQVLSIPVGTRTNQGHADRRAGYLRDRLHISTDVECDLGFKIGDIKTNPPS